MKRLGVFLGMVFLAMLLVCSSDPADRVEVLNNWSFQFNSGTNDYSLFFGFEDKNGNDIAADANVKIRIVNTEDEVVFEDEKAITEQDFGTYTSQAKGDNYLANLRIPKEEIMPGRALDGTVYFTVYNDKAFLFDECNCQALYNLPVKDIVFLADGLPLKIEQKAYDGSIGSVLQIESIDCETETNYLISSTITIFGQKTYSGPQDMGYDHVAYKIYDSENYMVESGTVYLNGLGEGEKFRDDSLTIYDLMPGETYTISFSAVQ